MNLKKNPKADLENYSMFFMQLGLVLALLVSLLSIEYKTYDRTLSSLGNLTMNDQLEEEVPITQRIEPVAPPPPAPPAPEIIQVVKDKSDIKETVLQSTETNETEKVQVKDVVTVNEDEDVAEDVPFAIIENAPIFPGCESLPKSEQKKCLSDNITDLVNKKFNVDLAADLGLTPGKKRISVIFKIDKNGEVTDIQARAPHPRLEKEAIRVVSLIPKMTPGKQRGRAVGVKYSLPIVFNVQE